MKPIFETILDEDQACSYQMLYRVMPDGTEVCNLWQLGDNTSGNGVDMTVDQMLAEHGLSFSLDLARKEYAQLFPTFQPDEANKLLGEVARANNEVITAQLDDLLYHYAGLAVTDLGDKETKTGLPKAGRYDKAWQLFEAGRFKLPAAPGQPWLVDSQETTKRKAERTGAGNFEYQVFLNVHTGQRQCECYDHTNNGHGFCKHVLLVAIASYAAELLLDERKAA